MLRRDEESRIESEYTRVRSVSDHAYMGCGSGQRLLQLIVHPAFEGWLAWEVIRSQEGWKLYKIDVVETAPSILLKGWKKLSISSVILEQFQRRIASLALPLDIGEPIIGADGATTQLAAFSGFAEWRFRWWSHNPPTWQPLVDIADEMFVAFSAAGVAHDETHLPPIEQ